MGDTPDLGRALVDSLRAEELKDLAGEYAELGIDALLTDGVLKDLPVVNTVRALAKAGVAVKDYLLIQKLAKFLGPLDSIPPEVRRQVVDKLESDPHYGRKVGEHLIQLLDRVDAHQKPAMLARTFKAYAEGEIEVEMFHRLNYVIEGIPWFEVPHIRRFQGMAPQERLKLSKGTLSNLASVGLATVASGWGTLVYEPNPVCEAFLKLELDRIGA